MVMKLEIELVPATSFYNNVRSIVPSEKWDILRKQCYKNANYQCEICGGKGEKWPIECHELWQYDDKNNIQKLIRLIGLCPNCHEVKHFGHTQLMGNSERAISHMMKVNNIDRKEVEKIIENSFEIWRERSLYDWEIDISFLGGEYGLK